MEKRLTGQKQEYYANYATGKSIDPNEHNLIMTEVIERVEVPLVRSMFEYVAPFKQARRREDDIA